MGCASQGARFEVPRGALNGAWASASGRHLPSMASATLEQSPASLKRPGPSSRCAQAVGTRSGASQWKRSSRATSRRFASARNGTRSVSSRCTRAGPDAPLRRRLPRAAPATGRKPAVDRVADPWIRRRGTQEPHGYAKLNPNAQRDSLLARIAIKDAVRRWLWNRGHGPVFPLQIQDPGAGRRPERLLDQATHGWSRDRSRASSSAGSVGSAMQRLHPPAIGARRTTDRRASRTDEGDGVRTCLHLYLAARLSHPPAIVARAVPARVGEARRLGQPMNATGQVIERARRLFGAQAARWLGRTGAPLSRHAG